MVIAQQTTNIRSQGLAGLQQRRKADIRQRQIAEQERSNELEQRRIAEELRTPEQRALQELQSIPTPAEGQRLYDPYGGIVVSFDENVIGLAKATGISPSVAYGLVQSGQLKMQGENIIYKGVAIGSSAIAEQEALRIVTARGQTGTSDSYTPTSRASQVQKIAESNKDLKAGEVLDIARELKIVPNIEGAKPQLEFLPSKEGTLSYRRIPESSLNYSNKGLNISPTSNINGIANVLSGTNVLGNRPQSIRSRIGDWLNKFIGTGKDFKRAEEVYQGNLGEIGAFVKAEQPRDTGTLIGIRLPSPEERVIIEEGNIKEKALWQVPVQYATLGYINFGKQMPSDVQRIIQQPNIAKFAFEYLSPKTQYRIAEFNVRQEEAVKKLNLLNKPLYQAEEDYSAGKITVEQYNAKISKVIERPEYKKALEEYQQRSLTPEQVLTLSSASSTNKAITGGLVGLGNVVAYTNPISRIILGTEQVRTSSEALNIAQTDLEKTKAGAGILLGTGIAISGATPFLRTTSNVVTASRTVQNPFVRSLKNYGTLTAGTGLATYFGIEQGMSTYRSTGDIAYSLGKGLGTYAGIVIPTTIKYLKDTSPDLKFLEKPEVRIERRRVEMVENRISEKSTVPKISLIRKEGRGGKLSLSEVSKGKTEVTEYYPKERQVVDILEQRNIQPIRNQLRSVFGIKPKLETFKGKGIFVEGKGYKEVINYGDYSKITNINNLGKGSVRIVDIKGRTVSKNLISPSNEVDIFLKSKKREEKIVIDENIQNRVNVLEVRTDKGTKRQATTIEGDILIDEFGNRIIPSTESAKIFGEFKTTTRQMSNLKTGKARVEVENIGLIDITKASPRVGTANIFRDGKNIQVKKSLSQEIVYGMPKERDIIKGTKGEKGGIVFASYSPKSNRQIKQVAGTQEVIIEVNPKSTILNPAKKLSELQRRETELLVSKLNKERSLERFNIAITDLKDKFSIAKQNIANSIQSFRDKFTPEKPIVKVDGEGLPKMVGGTGLVLEFPRFSDDIKVIEDMSNQFIVQTPQLLLKNVPSIKIGNIPSYDFGASIIGRNTNIPNFKVGTRLDYSEDSKVDNFARINVDTNNINKVNQIDKVNLDLTPNVRTEIKVNQDVTPKLDQLQKQEFKYEEPQLFKQKIDKPIRPEPRTPKKPRPIEFDFNIPSERKSTARETLGQLYEAFARTKGEDISLGKFTTKREAEEILSKQLKSTLKASGFVEQAGRKLRATELRLLGSEFTPSKVDIFRIVQRKGRRLSARPEVSEIQFFKSKARKRSSFF